ncbi:sensor histidine kinase [Pseudonocardia broussonetiae]|uniref:sensor histidine kinase n=1 Tax=Pseudonocardia broussonetiae TaxID=2736640 RepID=UPI001F044702|nr:sensor histidine kinase [Pseudonocardia broussonetiae]
MGVTTEPEPVDIGARVEWAIGRYGPFAGLAIGSAITAATQTVSGPAARPLAALVAAAAVWAYVLAFRTSAPAAGDCGRPRVRASDPRVGPVYVVVLLLLTAALVHLSPWFAFLALAGYAHSYEYLRGRWRYVGIAAMAVLHAYGTIGGGLNELGPLLVVAWAVITVLIATVATTFTVMGARTAELSQRRARTIADLNETNRRLAESLDENAELHTRLLAQAREAGVSDERARMAREIHDTLAQGLTGIVTQLEAADSADEAARRRHVDTARALARESLTEARRSVDALAPGRLAGARLPDAITDMAKEWAETAEVGVHVEVTGDPVPLLPDIEVTLYRVAQESLANVGRHAGATRAGLTLSYMDDVVVLDVRDDGTGFDPTAARTGFGLTAMEQRVRRVSGTFTVESAPGDGTAISASVPAIPAERGEA